MESTGIFLFCLRFRNTVSARGKFKYEQECIPVGFVPPTCCPYLPACTAPGGCTCPGGTWLEVYLVWVDVPGLGGTWSCGGGGVVPGPGDLPGPRGRGCTWSQEVYLVMGGVPGPGGNCPGGTWSEGVVYLVREGDLVQGGIPGTRGVYLVLGGVSGPGPLPLWTGLRLRAVTIMDLGGSGGVRILHYPPSCYLEPLHAGRLPFHYGWLLICVDVKSGQGFLLLPLGLILQPATVLISISKKI